jgi:hypothetical protein
MKAAWAHHRTDSRPVGSVLGTFRTTSAVDEARSTWVLSKDEARWRVRAFHRTYVQDIPIVPSAT